VRVVPFSRARAVEEDCATGIVAAPTTRDVFKEEDKKRKFSNFLQQTSKTKSVCGV